MKRLGRAGIAGLMVAAVCFFGCYELSADTVLDINEFPVLVISDNVDNATAKGRAVSAILKEMGDRDLSIISALTLADGKTEFEYRKDISSILLDYGLAVGDREEMKTCSDLVEYMREQNPDIPIFLFSEKASVENVPDDIFDKIDEYIVLGEDTATIVADRIERGAGSYLDSILPPIFKNLVEYVSRARHAMVVPGHAGGAALLKTPVGTAFFKFFGENIFRADISTGIPDWGSVLEHTGSIGEGEAEAAKTFGSDLTYFVLNGTSTSNKIVYDACVTPGDIVLADRNCHKSSVHAGIFSRAIPIYLTPSRNAYGIIGPIHMSEFEPDVIAKKIQNSPLIEDKDKKVTLSVITNSTYDGLCYDIAAIKPKLAESADNMLFDEAWYSYAKFHPIYKGRFAMTDLGTEVSQLTFANQSTHKLLAAFSQSSMIHVKNGTQDKIDPERFNEALMMHSSTSPFDPMLASIDVSAKMVQGTNGRNFIGSVISEAVAFRKKMASIYKSLTSGESGEEATWWYKLWQPDRITLTSEASVIDVPFEDVDDAVLTRNPECWVLKPNAKWHGFKGIENDNALIDPIKMTLLTPGITDNGEMDEWGIPAIILYAYLSANGVVADKAGFYNILFIATPGMTQSTAGTLIAKLFEFKKMFDENVPFSEVFPGIAQKYPETYENVKLKDFCLGMHDFYKRKKLVKITVGMYSTFPEQVMEPGEAYDQLVKGNIEYVALDKLMGRIPAIMLVPYPPGISVIMPGEKFTEKTQEILDYFAMSEEFDNKYPGFTTEIHGVTIVTEGEEDVYKVMCVKE